MKYTAATLALLASLSAAQDTPNPFGDIIPRCAVDCLVTGIESVGCDVRDPTCACAPESQASLASEEFISCLTEACSANEVGAAIAGGGAICQNIASETAEGSATETESAESEPTSSSDAGSSTSTATSAEAEPTGNEAEEDEGSSDDGGASSGDDEGSDADGDAGSDDEGAAAAVPAIFGGAAVLAAVLAL